MFDSNSSYRQLFKATSIFGGVQIVIIFISIIKSKFIAVLLGTAGVGILALLTSTTSLINSLSNFGLSTAAVRNVSEAYGSGDDNKFGKTVSTLRKLVWVAGLIGFFLTLILSPFLSRLAFGNDHYTYTFAFISIAALIGQLSAGKEIILRSTGKIGYLSKATIWGAVIGLFTSVFLYYFFGEKGIAPSIVISAFSIFLLYWHYCSKVIIPKVKHSYALALAEGKEMVRMGSLISIIALIGLGTAYVIQLFISNTGSIEQLGLYSAGFAIINTYVGMIFTAMGVNYFSRLSAVASSNEQSRIVINQQIEIALLMLTPLITAFLIFINLIIVLLYSVKFIPVNDMILWAALGMFFKVASWSIAYVFLAKGDIKLFFWNELFANIYLLGFNIVGYKYLGLTGLGVSFLAMYIVYGCQVYFIAKARYEFAFTNEFYKTFTFQLALAVICFLLVRYIETPYSYLIGSFVITVSVYYTYIQLDKRVDLKQNIMRYIKRS